MPRYQGTPRKQKQSHDPNGQFLHYNKAEKCVTGKNKYGAPNEARKVLIDMWRTVDCTGLEIYLCRHCSTYHLGTVNDWIRKENDRISREEMEG